jgi:hypothetical protein
MMIAVVNFPDLLTWAVPPKHELLETHRSKISPHHAKTRYDYPTIRLPFTFSGHIGL